MSVKQAKIFEVNLMISGLTNDYSPILLNGKFDVFVVAIINWYSLTNKKLNVQQKVDGISIVGLAPLVKDILEIY